MHAFKRAWLQFLLRVSKTKLYLSHAKPFPINSKSIGHIFGLIKHLNNIFVPECLLVHVDVVSEYVTPTVKCNFAAARS